VDLFSQLGGIARRERNDILDGIGLPLNRGARLHLIVPNTGGCEPDQHGKHEAQDGDEDPAIKQDTRGRHPQDAQRDPYSERYDE
jgi:hypothetical protein